jgi:hypothetical protein
MSAMFVHSQHDFEQNINSPTAPLAIDFDPGRAVLLICFSGLRGKLGFPVFEFNKITSKLQDVNKIYLRDQHRIWYHRGVNGIGDNIGSVVTFLRDYTLHPSTKRVVVLGNSGGAYAALLFGYLLSADEVHAFSPKTVLDPLKRLWMQDFPRVEPARILWQLFWRGQREYFDLRDVFSKSTRRQGNFHIYYSANYLIDDLHAHRMGPLAGIHLHGYEYDDHNLIKILRQSGELVQIIEKALHSP